MVTGEYMKIGNDIYTVDNCEISYDYPSTASTIYGSNCSNYKTVGTNSKFKIKAYRTSASCGTLYNEYDECSTNNIWKLESASTSTACTFNTIKWGIDGCSVEYEYGYGWQKIADPRSAEEIKAQKEKHFKDRFSQIIQDRCAPNINVRQNTKRKPLPIPADIREQRARQTLRRVIGDQKYLSFIKHGFISVKARSGLVYQIFTGHGITHVFNQGTLAERLCVILQGNFPPTDSLIMRYLLILNNEQQFRSLAIKHSISGHERSHQINGPAVVKPLAEIFKELKSKVA